MQVVNVSTLCTAQQQKSGLSPRYRAAASHVSLAESCCHTHVDIAVPVRCPHALPRSPNLCMLWKPSRLSAISMHPALARSSHQGGSNPLVPSCRGCCSVILSESAHGPIRPGRFSAICKNLRKCGRGSSPACRPAQQHKSPR